MSIRRDAQQTPQDRVVVVTGASGAGRSTAINALEDLGFEAIDNLPLSLVPRLLEDRASDHPVALGIDVRNRDFTTRELLGLLDRLHRSDTIRAELVFLDCDHDVLLRRYSETRRRHPLATEMPPDAAVARELELLAPFRARADVLIDTGEMTPHDLRMEMQRWFDPHSDVAMTVSAHSFSYKRGTPPGLDMMFDCRFLRNPHWVEALRPLDGRHPDVAAHVHADPRFDGFVERVRALVEFALPAHVEEGRTHVAIGFGCTGGRHRSVAVAEKLSRTLEQAGWHVSIRHREIERRT